jgi:hypothetical protein
VDKDDIIRMAQECQLIGIRPHLDGIYEQSLERFAALVAAAEREECTKVVEELLADTRYEKIPQEARVSFVKARDAIRARGQDAS